MHSALRVLIATGSALLVVWLMLVLALAIGRPKGISLGDALRLVPDILRLFKRLAAHPAVPRRARMVLVLCVAYLASPIDLIPDFLPVIGHVDDAIVVVLALRWVARLAGRERIVECWPGTATGLAALLAVVGLPTTSEDDFKTRPAGDSDKPNS